VCAYLQLSGDTNKKKNMLLLWSPVCKVRDKICNSLPSGGSYPKVLRVDTEDRPNVVVGLKSRYKVL
jgi:hypothetical protein